MQDRVPLKPNRMLITPENGAAPYYATVTRADEPTQEGTPLNKATLWPDNVAYELGLGSDSVPKDGFVALNNNINSRAWMEVARYDTAGSYTFEAPEDGVYGAFIVGAGGGGGAASSHTPDYAPRAQGGCSGFSKTVTFDLSSGETIPVVVGEGGKGGKVSGLSLYYEGHGGSSACNGVTADGGSGGGASSRFEHLNENPTGAQITSGDFVNHGYIEAYGGEIEDQVWGQSAPWQCYNPFSGASILGAGGHGSVDYYERGFTSNGGKDLVTGKGAGDGSAAYNSDVIAQNATENGSGGGGAAVRSTSGDSTATSGKGGDGLVIIYKRRYYK